jgi:putative transposase
MAKIRRPHRLERSRYKGVVTVAFTVCVRHRHRILANDPVVEALVPMLKESADQCGCKVMIYVFMPDHLHVLLTGIDETSDCLSAMEKFKHRSGMWFKRKDVGGAWQEGFYDHIVRFDEGWQGQGQYILANPVRAGLVTDWWTGPYIGSCHFDFETVIRAAIWS